MHRLIPYVCVSKLNSLTIVNKGQSIQLAFDRWELHEYLTLPETKQLTRIIKIVGHTEKLCYVNCRFPIGRKNQINKIASHFDFCDLHNIRLYSNLQYNPYENLNRSKETLYDMFSRFQSSYYYGINDGFVLNRNDYILYSSLILINCSKQNDILTCFCLCLFGN